MEYNSVTDYFARLHLRSLILFFVSLLMFLLLFYLLLSQNLTPVMAEGGELIAYAFVAFALMDASMSFVLMKAMLRNVKSLPSLGDRMDRYAQISLVRFALLLSGSILLIVALYLSGDQRIVVVYGIYLFFFLFAWPTRSRLCTELELKENEREVVFGK